MNPYFESITTADVADFIGAKVRSRGLAPKTARVSTIAMYRMFILAPLRIFQQV
jgi:hypothetical protein